MTTSVQELNTGDMFTAGDQAASRSRSAQAARRGQVATQVMLEGSKHVRYTSQPLSRPDPPGAARADRHAGQQPSAGACPLALPASVLARWQHVTAPSSPTTVLPDGCSDLILRIDPRGQCDWRISPLAKGACEVQRIAGEVWLGYRFQPGATLDTVALLSAAQAIWRHTHHRRQIPVAECMDSILEARILEAINVHVHLDPRAREALATLAHAPSVGRAAHCLGVSERSLERLTLGATGEPPRYWRALARVRRAAQALVSPEPLAAIAADHGFADQAHFSRECLRWLGQTPSQLRLSPALLTTVAQSGYG